MRGLIDPKPPQDIFTVGLAFEPALAYLWKEEHPGWRLSPGEVQYVTDRYGFPACATIDRRASRGKARRVVEMKIAHHTDEWGDPDLAGDCPTDYALQVIAQQLLTGLKEPADLMVMTAFFKHRTYVVEFDQQIADWMVVQCRRFYESLSGSTPPPLDDSLSTYKAVKELHPHIDGSSIEVPEPLITQIQELREEIGPMEGKLRGLRVQLLDMMGNAKTACVNGQVVADRRPHARGGVTLVVR